MTKLLAIYRAECFSPNSVEKDKAIMDEVGFLLQEQGYEVSFVREDELNGSVKADLMLTMGRQTRTLDILKEKESQGVIVINSPESVNACARATIDNLMRTNDIPTAPLDGNDGYWLKRGDQAAQEKTDVVFAKDETERDLRLSEFRKRGITDVVITAHVKGDCVKFYGVRGARFFKTFYPCDDGDTKFDDEKTNGQSHHYGFSRERLENDAEKLASLTGTDIYGGDCIVRNDGSYAIIDFNDWPSFSRCRKEAAQAMVTLIKEKIRYSLRSKDE